MRLTIPKCDTAPGLSYGAIEALEAMVNQVAEKTNKHALALLFDKCHFREVTASMTLFTGCVVSLSVPLTRTQLDHQSVYNSSQIVIDCDRTKVAHDECVCSIVWPSSSSCRSGKATLFNI